MSNELEMKKMVDFLNYLLAMDNVAITQLFNKRVITHSTTLINNSKIMVAESIRTVYDKGGKEIEAKTFYQLSILGLLNGAYYNDKKKVIAAVFHPEYKDGKIIRNFDIINIEELKKYEQDNN